jgi:chloride channel 3/4/5
MWQSFVCAMVAAVTLKAFNPFRTGKLVLYQVTYSSGWHGFEMVPFAVLGIIGGFYGGLFIKLNMKIAKWRKSSWWGTYPVLEVLVVAIITALINFPNKFTRAQSSELVYTLFAECKAITDDQFGICKTGAASGGVIVLLLEAAALGFVLASVTFGLQIPAGIILPSMAIGALYGRALGILVQIWQKSHSDSLIFAGCEPDIPCITPGTYAIIGAASALGGVTRMTVSIVVIMFELTGALTYVLPIMIAVMVSKWVGDAFGRRGIYETWIQFNEYPFLDNRDESAIPDVPVSQIMTQIDDLAVLTATGHTLQSIREFLVSHPYRGFPVVLEATQNILLGYISRTELLFALKTAAAEPRNLDVTFSAPPLATANIATSDEQYPTTLDLRPWMDQTPITLNAKSSLQLTVAMFQKLGLRYVLFCDRGGLKGLLTKKDVWYVLDRSGDADAALGGGTSVP